MKNETIPEGLDLDDCKWLLAVQRSKDTPPGIAVLAVRAVAGNDAARFLPSAPPEVTALGSIVFVESPRGMWRPALKFSVHDPANTAAEPIAKGAAATHDDGAVSAAEQVFSSRAAGMTREEQTTLISRAAFRLGQGEARGEVRDLLRKFGS